MLPVKKQLTSLFVQKLPCCEACDMIEYLRQFKGYPCCKDGNEGSCCSRMYQDCRIRSNSYQSTNQMCILTLYHLYHFIPSKVPDFAPLWAFQGLSLLSREDLAKHRTH